jgi:hypothetical protein
MNPLVLIGTSKKTAVDGISEDISMKSVSLLKVDMHTTSDPTPIKSWGDHRKAIRVGQ